MSGNLQEILKNRRTYYSISNQSTISDEELKNMVEDAVMHVPSAFNSQTARVVILLNEQHTQLWDIVKNNLKEIISEESFKQTEAKINNCFSSGYGTILFYEDNKVIRKFQEDYSSYKDNFPIWSQQAAGMLQWVVWTMLKEKGLGASLQHYNPLIDEEVAKRWDIDPDWKLIAQMPFGIATQEPGEKQFHPIKERVFVFE